MKLVIAGSRTFININRFDIEKYINFFDLQQISIIISGKCKTGPDNSAFWYAKHNKINFEEFPADWDKYGKAAGPIRNKQMAEYGDALLLIWDGKSKGSANMKKEMLTLSKPIYEVILKTHNT